VCHARIVRDERTPEVVAEREGFEPSMELPPNRISNWTLKRDQRDS
jgi:hypothetical protein